MTKSMTRAERAAGAVVGGQEILATLKSARKQLVEAAEQARPPVAAISGLVLAKHGEVVKEPPVRQFIGIAIRAILEQAGFEVSYTGVRLNGDPVFRTGSVYQRTNNEETESDADVVRRIIKALKPAEANHAFDALRQYFPVVVEQKILSLNSNGTSNALTKPPKLKRQK